MATKAKVTLGMCSYTFKEHTIDEVLHAMNTLSLTRLSLKDFHLPYNSPPEDAEEVARKAKKAGVEIYAGGVFKIKRQEDVQHCFDYARRVGMRIMIVGGNHIPAGLLGLLTEKAIQYDIQIAIHNHGFGDKDYGTAQIIYEKIRNLDRHIGICLDVGHSARINANASQEMERCADRIMDVHINDVTPIDASIQEPFEYATEIGRGIVDIPAFIRSVVKVQYGGVLALEYKKRVRDPMPGAAESIGYLRGVLASV